MVQQGKKPFYLLIAEWIYAENRWVTSSEIAEKFSISTSAATNHVTYILTSAPYIKCEVKNTENYICAKKGRCKRMIKIYSIISKQICRSSTVFTPAYRKIKVRRIHCLEELVRSKEHWRHDI
ncbi:CaiF/GrlA family transcriptional regulator [Escherichia coli]|uniref:CaiF/GrlA family transcriptional regulator n=1 Tax=Escherichia coli TaxID=562 RepID=UPI0016502A89|nr:CaiF/GrlA family transcriptional regulator [Escherichia coli]EIH1623505.1 CaiF/GrlA family transcriptional regulator [Escherichia coli]MDF3916891.1 CaiF/GrlA family transcriptional regulator [Escherichia coli]HBA6778227.1 CaiF/GrlA family transcriptional regulator [Escherichia coli]HBA7230313.1 CaiF/GrlA family transcriptional regulator [Escherichia coli]